MVWDYWFSLYANFRYFPDAGITFWDVAHETNGGLIGTVTQELLVNVNGYWQNGPGITGLVTPIKTAYWNHTPLLLVTPQAANKTMGQGGFQESRANEFIKIWFAIKKK